VFALKRAALLLQELAGGVVSSEVIDIYPKVKAPARIKVRYQRVNELIGVNIPPAKVHGILEAMGMAIIESNEEAFTVEVPTNKSDVLREVDMIEEILRIYGFNNVPIPSKVTTSMAIAPSPSPSEIRNKIGDLLAAQGFNEMMALSLSESRYYQAKETLVPAEELVYVNNTSNVHLDIMRPHMVYSGLEAILRNQNRQESDLNLFEFGRTYRKEGESFEEINRLTLFMTGRRQPESWLADDQAMVSYYGLKAYVDSIFTRLGVQGYQQEEVTEKGVITYGTRYFRGQKELVRFGRLQGSLLKGMDIKGEVFYADFNWDHVFQALPKKRVQFTELNKYPSMRRDLALVVDHAVKFSEISAIAGKSAKKLLRETNLFNLYVNEDQLGAGKKSYAVSFIFEDPSRTLKIQEVDKVMEKIITTCETQLGAQVRR
jgi:phenylalanyl-tRNA synthetase beta chain